MPGGISGLDLARKVRQHDPNQPILLASGYARATGEVYSEGFDIIAKPLTTLTPCRRLSTARSDKPFRFAATCNHKTERSKATIGSDCARCLGAVDDAARIMRSRS
jgi:hypothetical protein